jgi:hypothetical protein
MASKSSSVCTGFTDAQISMVLTRMRLGPSAVSQVAGISSSFMVGRGIAFFVSPHR